MTEVNPPTTAELREELWCAVKNARDDAANDVSAAQRRLDYWEALLSKMKAAGMADHLPSIDDVIQAWKAT